MVRTLSPSIAQNVLDTHSLDGSGVATKVAKITKQPSGVDRIEIAVTEKVTQVAESVKSVQNDSLGFDGMHLTLKFTLPLVWLYERIIFCDFRIFSGFSSASHSSSYNTAEKKSVEPNGLDTHGGTSAGKDDMNIGEMTAANEKVSIGNKMT